MSNLHAFQTGSHHLTEHSELNVGCACHRSSSSYIRRSAPCAAFPAARAISSSTSTSSSKLSSNFRQPAYRWFGYHSQTSSFCVEKACIIQIAAYDLESGESYVALVDPGHYHPDWRMWGRKAFKEHGIPKSVIQSEGIPLVEAVAGLVDFIRTSTPTGDTPALVAHRGFNYHFPHMQFELSHALLDIHSFDLGSPQKQQQLDGWPTDWLFHDTYLMAGCLLRLQPLESPLRPYVKDLSGMGLARSLLLNSYRVEKVQPLERAYVHAANAARITPILLELLQSPPQPHHCRRRKQQPQIGLWYPSYRQSGISWQHAAELYESHRQWLSRPWALEYNLKQGLRFSYRFLPSTTDAVMCPPQMVQAAWEAGACACRQLPGFCGYDPIVDGTERFVRPY